MLGTVLYTSSPQGAVPATPSQLDGHASSEAPLEASELESPGLGPRTLCFSKPSWWHWHALELEKKPWHSRMDTETKKVNTVGEADTGSRGGRWVPSVRYASLMHCPGRRGGRERRWMAGPLVNPHPGLQYLQSTLPCVESAETWSILKTDKLRPPICCLQMARGGREDAGNTPSQFGAWVQPLIKGSPQPPPPKPFFFFF